MLPKKSDVMKGIDARGDSNYNLMHSLKKGPVDDLLMILILLLVQDVQKLNLL